jgi:hypothetical protein
MVNKTKWMNWYDYLKRKNLMFWFGLSTPLPIFIYLFICKTEDLANASRTHFSSDYLDWIENRLTSFFIVLMFILALGILYIVLIPIIWRRQLVS